MDEIRNNSEVRNQECGFRKIAWAFLKVCLYSVLNTFNIIFKSDGLLFTNSVWFHIRSYGLRSDYSGRELLIEAPAILIRILRHLLSAWFVPGVLIGSKDTAWKRQTESCCHLLSRCVLNPFYVPVTVLVSEQKLLGLVDLISSKKDTQNSWSHNFSFILIFKHTVKRYEVADENSLWGQRNLRKRCWTWVLARR